jgi:transcription-repair coupling factor (superfamily II helicase)
MSLRPLLDVAIDDGRLRALATETRAALADGAPVSAHMSAAVRPYLLAALLESEAGLADRAALVVAADDRGARDLARELRAFLGESRRVRYYPSRGTGYESHVAPPPHLVGLRIAALDELSGDADRGDPAPIVVASAVALAEVVPDVSLRPVGFALSRGEEIDLSDVAELLVEAGYERADQVEERGQFAARGGILDVFPATEERAVRVELFGDEIESLRWFSTFTQRSLGEAERVELAPAAELAAEHRELAEMAIQEMRQAKSEAAAEPGPGEAPGGRRRGEAPLSAIDVLPLDHFQAPLDVVPDSAAVVIAMAEEIDAALRDHWQDVTTTMADEDARRLYVEVSTALPDRACLEVSSTHADQPHSFRAQRPAFAVRNVGEAEAELEKQLRSGYLAAVCFEHRGEAERARYGLSRIDAALLDPSRPLTAQLPPSENGRPAALLFGEGALLDGFISPELRLAVIPWRRLLHRRRPAAAPPARGRLQAFTELRVGDHVVHEDHGIARFAGFETKTLAGITRDYLQLEYRGDDRVFVPAEQLAKISRYIGAGGAAPQLSALGSKRWDGMKARARRAAGELAGELLNLYAERSSRPGHAYPPDGEWQLDLERAFPYRETADQLQAIDAVKGDMETPTPMDRLICGDVGYGKTEVAMRAALKAVIDGKQVMMLVPTTILAQQHLGTFRERLAEFPVVVEMVSRLRRPAEVREVLRRFAAGQVDVLIGTHRLLSRDVRGKDLGLLIVDEEQRFGVKQKELLRQLKLKMDVISLSATPIPRTLQMSLAGLRDISVIETPPEGRRPVRTYVGPYDERLVKRAIEREADRGGQAFFLHNLIETLHETAEGLRALCPGVRFAEAHGQMDERELEATMLGFVRGEADVLVATTIIESGLDIPTANTLIVERADQLGLAQAYQIRGRVGRSRERAFAYLLYPSEAALSPEAAARLSVLSDHTELGSGFAIAMRDLELRGAGDLLGDEQSGHVGAIGFELYVQMLDDAVEELRGEATDGARAAPEGRVRLDLDVDAYVPADYIPYEAAKIDVHRRVAGARDPGELRALADELADRFGPPPEPIESLLALQRARIEFGRAGARVVEVRGGRLSVSPLELDAEESAAVLERVPDAIYEWRPRTLSIRVPDDPAARLAAAVALADAVAGVRSLAIAA